jgi:Pretoxin HINT domain
MLELPASWNDNLYTADQFVAGFADRLTGGRSTQLRNDLYGDIVAGQHEGAAFSLGQSVGLATGLVTIGVATGGAGIVAGGLDTGFQLWQNQGDFSKIDLTSVAISAVSGKIGASVSAGLGKGGALVAGGAFAKTGLGLGARTAINAGVGFNLGYWGKVAENAFSGEELTNGAWQSGAFGGIGAGAGELLQAGAGAVLRSKGVQNTLARATSAIDNIKWSFGQKVSNSLDRATSVAEDIWKKIFPQCFIAGTEIQTIDGTKNIEDIHVGDWVLSDDPNTVGDIEYKQVLNTFVKETTNLVDIYIDGEKITTTEEHPFWVPDLGWVAAKDLHAGTLLQTKTESWLDVDRVELHGGLTTVYNFEVAGFHTYFVSELGLLVHNTCELIANKYPGDPLDPRGKIFGEVAIVDGKASLKNGNTIPKGEVDFIVTQDKRLIIGRKHVTISSQEEVLAAGHLTFTKGKIRLIDNLSGHFLPTAEEGLRYPKLLQELGLDLSGTHLQLYEINPDPNGLITKAPKRVVNTRL